MIIFVKKNETTERNCDEKIFYVSYNIILVIHFLDRDGGTGD